MSRRAARVDANHERVVDALRAAGCSVQSLAAVGNGCPDLLCSISGHTWVIEVKDGAKAPSDRLLTPMQKKWHTEWKGAAHIAESVEQAMVIVAYYRSKRAA